MGFVTALCSAVINRHALKAIRLLLGRFFSLPHDVIQHLLFFIQRHRHGYQRRLFRARRVRARRCAAPKECRPASALNTSLAFSKLGFGVPDGTESANGGRSIIFPMS